MTKLAFVVGGAFFALSCLVAEPAFALAPVTFVSGKGVDSGACASPASPCRTFQYALGQTSAGGEIKALDPADYRPVTIDKSISITGVKGAGVVPTTGGDAITISAGANDAISLTGLIIDGFNQADTFGVKLTSAGQLTIRNCEARNVGRAGIIVLPTAGAKTFLIEDTIVQNSLVGVSVASDAGAVNGALHRVSLTNNSAGMAIFGPVRATVADSVVANNIDLGIALGGFSSVGGGEALIAHSIVTGNSVGVGVGPSYAAKSAGDNFINGNGVDVGGRGARLINVGTH